MGISFGGVLARRVSIRREDVKGFCTICSPHEGVENLLWYHKLAVTIFRPPLYLDLDPKEMHKEIKQNLKKYNDISAMYIAASGDEVVDRRSAFCDTYKMTGSRVMIIQKEKKWYQQYHSLITEDTRVLDTILTWHPLGSKARN